MPKKTFEADVKDTLSSNIKELIQKEKNNLKLLKSNQNYNRTVVKNIKKRIEQLKSKLEAIGNS